MTKEEYNACTGRIGESVQHTSYFTAYTHLSSLLIVYIPFLYSWLKSGGKKCRAANLVPKPANMLEEVTPQLEGRHFGSEIRSDL